MISLVIWNVLYVLLYSSYAGVLGYPEYPLPN